MADTTAVLLGRDATYRPFFRTRAKVAAFATTLAFFLAVQVLAAWSMYAAAREAMRAALVRELAGLAASGASALELAAARGSTDRELAEMVWRVREAGRLDNAMLVAPDMTALCADDREHRRRVSAFAATPDVVRRTLASGVRADESFELMGDRYSRHYLPLDARGVLVLEAHDSAADALASLNAPLTVGLVSAFVSALALAVVVVLVMRSFDRSRARILRMERLATAGALSSSIAHEVENPMGIILSGTQLLLDDTRLDAEQRSTLAEIVEEVKRAEGQLDAFLDLSRDIPLKPALEDVREVVEGTVRLVGHKLARSSVSVVKRLPGEPVMALVDRRKIRQAIVNVLLNSLDACEGTGGTVTIELRADEAGAAVLTISDDGRGMQPDVLARACEPFFSTKPSGTGLGLAQSRQIVVRHGGTLEIDSRPGAGTNVTIRLPGARRP